MDLLLFSHFLLCIFPSNMSRTLCCKHILTSQILQGTNIVMVTVTHKDLRSLAITATYNFLWRPYSYLRLVPFLLVLLPFHYFISSINFSCIPASGISSSFFPQRLVQSHPAQQQGSTSHRGGLKRASPELSWEG